MNIDKFGLGDWWPGPDQAAVGALDHVPADQWPSRVVEPLAELLLLSWGPMHANK